MLEPLPVIAPRVQPENDFTRTLPPLPARNWLAAGWADFSTQPILSLSYGFLVFVLSGLVIWGLIAVGLPSLILPALSGFLVIGPLLAIGLYEKSRRLAEGRTVTLSEMIVTHPRSRGQLVFAGLLLCLLVVLWLRAADLLYALFFGMLPFPGFDQVLYQLFTTPRGWALIITGSAVGGLFAAFAMALSLFSIPMLLERRVDALTALGTSFALTIQNLRSVLPWAAVVVFGFALSAATGLVGLIIIFPVLGHGTWHAWLALRPAVKEPIE